VPTTRPTKILLVRFSALGDVIQTLPVLTMLRKGFPHAKIGWVIDTGLAPAIEGHPALDYIHRCSRLEWKTQLQRPWHWSDVTSEFAALLREIRAVGYDAAIDVQGLFKTAVLPWLAGIPRRIGYGHGRELSGFFYTERCGDANGYFDPAVLHVEHMARLVRMLGIAAEGYKVEPPVVSGERKRQAAETLRNGFAERAPVVAIAPATQWKSKAWPETYWSVLIQQLLEQTNLNVLLMGSAADAPCGQRILNGLPAELSHGRVCNLFGQAPIRDMYAIYAQVEAAVGPDSAPLHIAGATDVPVVVGLYGPTGYRRTPPLGSPHVKLLTREGQLPCQPCHQRTCPLGTGDCMKQISPEEVFQALLQGLTEAGIEFRSREAGATAAARPAIHTAVRSG
jgi:lipopolysaccharide heptosyltransferase II